MSPFVTVYVLANIIYNNSTEAANPVVQNYYFETEEKCKTAQKAFDGIKFSHVTNEDQTTTDIVNVDSPACFETIVPADQILKK